MEQGDIYENGLVEYEEGRKGSLQVVTMVDIEPLDTHPNPVNNVEDEDDDLNFLDDGLSDS